MPKPIKLRGVYGKPLLKSGTSISMTPELLKKAGETILEAVKKEILKDIAKSRGIRGGTYPTSYQSRDPVPLPDSPKFVDSFTYSIRGKSTIEIVSDWPTADIHVGKLRSKDLETPPNRKKSTPPFKMWWLVRPKVNTIPIVTHTGQVIYRSAPEAGNEWIHPGFRRYSFIERGVKKGKEKFVEQVLAQEVAKIVAEDYRLI